MSLEAVASVPWRVGEPSPFFVEFRCGLGLTLAQRSV
jgi:hypothetical protein